jgi:hypothetical protein
MKLIRTYKKNFKLIMVFLILMLMSFINSLEGFIYANSGFCNVLVFLEVTSVILTLLLINIVWCVFDDGKCVTIKKH